MTTPLPPDLQPVLLLCEWETGPMSDGEYDLCGERSRFAVERSDHDPSYDATSDRAASQACESHLADMVMALMDGDDTIHALVTPLWDRP